MNDIFTGFILIAIGASVYLWKKDKKKEFAISIALLVASFVGFGITMDDSEEVEAEEPKEEEMAEVKEEEEIEEEPEEVEEETELPEGIDGLSVTDVRGDDSGKWKKAVSGFNLNMPDNALDYHNAYMEDGEVHFLISFSNNTTTSIRDSGSGYLYVDIMDYQDKEEHDAKKIGNGTLLKEYKVIKETGEIEELEF